MQPASKVNKEDSNEMKQDTNMYHDYANEKVTESAEEQSYAEEYTQHQHQSNRNEHNFPVKLHYMLSELENDGKDGIVSWQPHGRCFLVHKQQQFVEKVLPLWFRQTKLSSFHRQLNLYGFKRLTSGHDKGGYYHELFLRNKRFLSYSIQRTKIKGTGARKPSSPETEPSFYTIPYLPATRVPSENAPVSSVGNMPPLGPNMALGDVGLVSLQQLVASRELAVSILQHLAPPPLFNTSIRLLVEASQRQDRLQRFRVVSLHQEMGTIGSFEPHNVSMVSGRNDLVTAVTLALFRAKQDPAAFVGLPGYWRGSHG